MGAITIKRFGVAGRSKRPQAKSCDGGLRVYTAIGDRMMFTKRWSAMSMDGFGLVGRTESPEARVPPGRRDQHKTIPFNWLDRPFRHTFHTAYSFFVKLLDSRPTDFRTREDWCWWRAGTTL